MPADRAHWLCTIVHSVCVCACVCVSMCMYISVVVCIYVHAIRSVVGPVFMQDHDNEMYS